MPALYIALEREIPEFDSYVNGHALSKEEQTLDNIARGLEVTPLMEFFSMDPEEAAGFIEDGGGDPSGIDFADEQWFDAADGLKTVEALLAHFAAKPDALPNSAEAVAELKEWRAVLQRAAADGVGWHLEVDF